LIPRENNESKVDAPPNPLMDSTANPKVKTTKGKGVAARFLARNTLRVEGHAGALGWGLGRMTNGSIIPTNLYKLNNKLVTT
jgi:hypothetical protein